MMIVDHVRGASAVQRRRHQIAGSDGRLEEVLIRRFGRQLGQAWCRLCLRGAGEVHRLVVSTVHGQMLDVGLLRQLGLRGAGRRRRRIRRRALVLSQRWRWTLLGDLGL